jgi:hypothetical protein
MLEKPDVDDRDEVYLKKKRGKGESGYAVNHCLTLGLKRYQTIIRGIIMEIATVTMLVPPIIPIIFPMIDRTRKIMATILAQFFPLRKAHANTNEMMAMTRKNTPNAPKNIGALFSTQSGTEVPICARTSATLINTARAKNPKAAISSKMPPNISRMARMVTPVGLLLIGWTGWYMGGWYIGGWYVGAGAGGGGGA